MARNEPEELALESLRRLWPEAQETARPKTGQELLAIMRRDGLFLPEDQREERLKRLEDARDAGWRRS